MGRGEARQMGLSHLQKVPHDSTTLLVLVLEDFYDDFADACRKAKNRSKKKSHAKLERGYLTFYRARVEASSTVPTLSAGPDPSFEVKKPQFGTITGSAFQQPTNYSSVD